MRTVSLVRLELVQKDVIVFGPVDANRPLEEVLRVYSVIRNLKLGVDGKTAQFVVKSAFDNTVTSTLRRALRSILQAGVKVNRKTPTAIMKPPSNTTFQTPPSRLNAVGIKSNRNSRKRLSTGLALAQAYALRRRQYAPKPQNLSSILSTTPLTRSSKTQPPKSSPFGRKNCSASPTKPKAVRVKRF